ncbi:MAG: hypothetical protein IPP47_06910 [Bryobacterales bacterium]|nr:hypothetical protein [Bryobacterales bacterium]
MIPDAILYSHGHVRGVVDAKYKSIHPSSTAPQGPQREDLYQMAAYPGRFAQLNDRSTWGLLAYPSDPTGRKAAPAEVYSPWSLNDGQKVLFAHNSSPGGDGVCEAQVLLTDGRHRFSDRSRSPFCEQADHY